MGQRLAKGRSPFVGDRNHVHHKLLALGLSHYEAVIVIYGIQAVMVGLAYLLRWQSDALICIMYGAFAAAMFALFVATERRRVPSSVSSSGRVLSDTKLARAGLWLSEMAPRFLAVVVPVRGGSGNSDSVVSGSLASPKPPGGGEPEERGDEENTTESQGDV